MNWHAKLWEHSMDEFPSFLEPLVADLGRSERRHAARLLSTRLRSSANLYRFSSKMVHANSGLYYNGYRCYWPEWQRLPNRDPLGDLGGLNLFGFVGNDPLNDVDAAGLAKHGGPYHAPDGVKVRCKRDESCSEINAKSYLLMRTIASHLRWDMIMPWPRGGGHHKEDLTGYWNALKRCRRLWELKNCDKPPPKPPVWCRGVEGVPGTAEQLERAGEALLEIGVAILVRGRGGAKPPIVRPPGAVPAPVPWPAPAPAPGVP
jgi:RHS repeat-associated protein